MDKPSENIRDLARHLLAVEASIPAANGEHEVERVCEKQGRRHRQAAQRLSRLDHRHPGAVIHRIEQKLAERV